MYICKYTYIYTYIHIYNIHVNISVSSIIYRNYTESRKYYSESHVVKYFVLIKLYNVAMFFVFLEIKSTQLLDVLHWQKKQNKTRKNHANILGARFCGTKSPKKLIHG